MTRISLPGMRHRMIIIGAILTMLLCAGAGWASPETPVSEPSPRDVYYQTLGQPAGPAATEMTSVYPRLGFLDNRVLIWVITQQHTYFGGFVLSLPLFWLLMTVQKMHQL